LKNSLASQQQMIVGEGKTATFRVNPAVAGLDMYWEFKRSLKFWGDALSTGTSELVVRGKDAVYLETLLGGTSEAALSKLEGMRLSTAAGSPAVVSSGGSIQSGSFSSGTYTLKLSAGATVVGSGTSMSFQAVASGSQIVKAGTLYGGTLNAADARYLYGGTSNGVIVNGSTWNAVKGERYSEASPEVISIRAASLLDEGIYTAVVKVPVGTSGAATYAEHRSEPWVLTVNALPLITEHPFVYPKFPGQPATLSVGGFFSPETRFTWYARYAGETAWLPLPSGVDPRTHVISNVQIADEGEYQLEATNGAGTVVSNGTYMAVERPAFLTLRTAGLSAGTVGVFPESALNLDVLVTGALSELPSGLPSGVTFQKLQPGNKWGNVNAPFVITGTACSVTSAGEEQEGYYRVSATGKVNGVVYSNVVKVEVYDRITFTSAKVASVVATAGESFTLTAPVTGYAPQYQWLLNGEAISGATLASYTQTASESTAGTYSVAVKNYKDGVTLFSSGTLVVAQVSVNDRPKVDYGVSSRAAKLLVEDPELFLSVSGSVSGTPGEVRYQWCKDGKALSGAGVSGVVYVPASKEAVEVKYEKKGVMPTDGGNYYFIATNAFGVSTGTVMTQVKVIERPKFLDTPQLQSVVAVEGDDAAVFRVNAIGGGSLSYYWYTKPASGGSFTQIDNGNSPVLIIGGTNANGEPITSGTGIASALDGSQYRVEVVSVYDGVSPPSSGPSNVATLKVASKASVLSVGSIKLNQMDTGGAARLALVGANTLRATATAIDPGSLKLSYQWRRNGEKIASGMVAASGSLSSGSSKFDLEYRLPADLASNPDGVYDVIVDNGAGVAASPAISVTLDPKIVSVQIPSAVNPFDPVKMNASFTGERSSYRYEWYNGSTLVRSGTASGASPFTVEHSISAAENTGTLAAGSYKLRVLDSAGAHVESKAVFMSVAKPVSITAQPVAPLRVGVDGSFTLSVGATGGGSLNYQWSRDGAAISAGGTSATLTRDGTGNLEGAYQVRVWNEFSTVISDVVNVIVSKNLGVNMIQPGTVNIGGAANLVANASGPGRLSYQWYKGASAILGATGESHKISPVTAADGAQYWVKVTSSESTPNNSVDSGSVSLGVRDVPRILVAPVSRIVGGSGTTSSKVSFTVVAESRAGGTLNFEWGNVGTGTYTNKGNTSTLTVTVPTETTRSESTYSVTVSSGDSADGKVQSGSITLTAKLTVLPSTQTKDKITTAGSDGVSVHTGWWVYWVKAKKKNPAEPESSRNGYYALERLSSGGVVTPGRAVWVWQSGSTSVEVDEWLAGDQSVVDAVASERGEFSALAARVASGSILSGDYAIAGRVEEEGEGSLYGAPDFVEGVYSSGTGQSMVEYALELNWDMEQVYRMDVYSDLDDVWKALKDALLNND
jgi:hypothetical protein